MHYIYVEEDEWKIDLGRILKLTRKPAKLNPIIVKFEDNYYDDSEFWPGMTNAQLATCGIDRGLLMRWRKVHANPESAMIVKYFFVKQIKRGHAFSLVCR